METGKVNRRKFIKIAGIGTGMTVFACSGLGYAAARRPDIDFFETESSGVKEMEGKVLVTYASKAGSTGEVAQAIADELNRQGQAVEVKLVKHATDITSYRAVIVGSAIRMGAWLPEAVKFVENNREVLRQKPTAYFLVSGYLRENTPEKIEEVSAFIDPVRSVLEPVDVGLFAGKMDYSKLSFMDRTIAKMVKSEEGDYRDWDAIRAWSSQVAQKMQV